MALLKSDEQKDMRQPQQGSGWLLGPSRREKKVQQLELRPFAISLCDRAPATEPSLRENHDVFFLPP